ncbi:hypothetical protein HK405_005802 [Cladochytrium tenue]|nr:hypothetical protein HK405_005802 [Cladochytrium tenue]
MPPPDSTNPGSAATASLTADDLQQLFSFPSTSSSLSLPHLVSTVPMAPLALPPPPPPPPPHPLGHHQLLVGKAQPTITFVPMPPQSTPVNPAGFLAYPAQGNAPLPFATVSISNGTAPLAGTAFAPSSAPAFSLTENSFGSGAFVATHAPVLLQAPPMLIPRPAPPPPPPTPATADFSSFFASGAVPAQPLANQPSAIYVEGPPVIGAQLASHFSLFNMHQEGSSAGLDLMDGAALGLVGNNDTTSLDVSQLLAEGFSSGHLLNATSSTKPHVRQTRMTDHAITSLLSTAVDADSTAGGFTDAASAVLLNDLQLLSPASSLGIPQQFTTSPPVPLIMSVSVNNGQLRQRAPHLNEPLCLSPLTPRSDTDVTASRSTSAAGTLPLYDHHHRKRSVPSIGSVPPFDVHPPPAAPSAVGAGAAALTTPALQPSLISAASSKMAIPPVTPTATAAPPLTREQQVSRLDEELLRIDFDDVTVAYLKELLRRRGMPSSGRKVKLLERIRLEVAKLHRTMLQDQDAAAASSAAVAASAASPSGSQSSSRSASPAASSRSTPSPPLPVPTPSGAPAPSYRGGGASPVVPASRRRSRGSPSSSARGPQPASSLSSEVAVAASKLAAAPADTMLIDAPTTADVASARSQEPAAGESAAMTPA